MRELTEVLYGNVYIKPLDQQNVAISDTFTFSPTAINEMRLGFNRRVSQAVPESYDGGWAKKLGIPGVSDETFPDFQQLLGGGRSLRLRARRQIAGRGGGFHLPEQLHKGGRQAHDEVRIRADAHAVQLAGRV